MPRPRRTDQEIGYLRSFWDEARTMEADFHGQVSIFTTATMRPGVLNFRIVYVSMFDDDFYAAHQCSYTFDFPTATEIMLAGQLWAAARILRKLVEDAVERSPRPGKELA